MSVILLKFPFSNSGQNHIYEVLDNTRRALLADIKKHKSTANLKELEIFFNQLYKSPLNNKSSINVYREVLNMSLYDHLDARLQSIDLNNINFEASTYTAKTPTFKTIQTYSNLLDQKLIKLNNIIKSIQSTGNFTSMAKLQQLSADMTTLRNTVKNYLAQPDNSQISVVLGGSLLTTPGQLVRAIDIYISLVRAGTDVNLSKLGTSFEVSITEALRRFYGNALISCTKTGANQVSRGVYQGQKMDSISYSITTDGLSKTLQGLVGQNLKTGFTKTENGYTYTYHPGSEKSAKMDVQAVFAAAPDLRISAKSWTKKSNNLGTSSIAASLTRSVGPNIIKYYTLSMLNPQKDQFEMEKNVKWRSAEMGHKLARLGIISDIVMGLNQREAGRAEVLIIDMGSEIIVRDISTLITQFLAHEDSDKSNSILYISKYNNTNIQNQILNRYEGMSGVKINRSNTFYGLSVLTVLNKMKVTVRANRNII